MQTIHCLTLPSTIALAALLAACAPAPLTPQASETPAQLQSDSSPAKPGSATDPATCKDCGTAAVPTATPIARNSAQPIPLETTPVTAAAALPPQPLAAPPKPAGVAALPNKSAESKTVSASGDLAHGYYLNVGVFAVAANADKVLQKLQGAGLQPIVQQLTTRKGHVTRVRAGPFATKADAERTAKTVRALGLDAVVFKH